MTESGWVVQRASLARAASGVARLVGRTVILAQAVEQVVRITSQRASVELIQTKTSVRAELDYRRDLGR